MECSTRCGVLEKSPSTSTPAAPAQHICSPFTAILSRLTRRTSSTRECRSAALVRKVPRLICWPELAAPAPAHPHSAKTTHLVHTVRSADYIESTYQYESTDVQMRNGKAVRARLPDVKNDMHTRPRSLPGNGHPGARRAAR